MPHSLTHPERLTITGPQGETYQGGDQEWYRDLWQRRAGCGPTTAAALLSYLSQTRPGLRPMVPAAARTQAGFLRYTKPSMLRHVWGCRTTPLHEDIREELSGKKDHRA